MRLVVAGTILVFVVPSWAAESHVTVSLAYERDETAAAACPDETTFRALVASRLGYDPFQEAASRGLSVDFQANGQDLVGHLSVTSASDDRVGSRVLRTDRDDCAELAASIALAAALAIDPSAVEEHAAEPAASEPPPEAPPPPPIAPPPVPAPAAPRPVVAPNSGARLDAGAVLAGGVVPGIAAGGRLRLAFDAGAWSLGAEGVGLLPSSASSAFGNVSASALYGSLAPCIEPALERRILLELCVVGSVGVLHSEGSSVTRALSATDLFATVGPRLGLLVLPTQAFGLLAAVDFPIPLSKIHLTIDDLGTRREVWASNWAGAVGGLSAVARFR